MLGDLSGRVALVTGAGSPDGIGYASAIALGELGATLVVTSMTPRINERAAELRALGIETVGLAADLTRVDEVQRLSDASRQAFGQIDVVVNNAGMTSVILGSDRVGSLDTISLEDWHVGLQRNLDTAFLVTRAFMPDMCARGWGRVVMVASTTGPVNAMTGHSVYGTAKAAMVGLTRALALEGATDGVTVNAVGPGWIDTGSATDEERHYGATSPLGRSGTPREVAAVIGALCLPGFSYLTGQLVVIDGANSILESRG